MSPRINHRIPIVLIAVLFAIFLIYHYSYYFPFTNNAFVVSNVRPVAANVNGYITHLYVKNGEYVKKGQPLFEVFRKPYFYAYEKAKSDVSLANAELVVLETNVKKTAHLLKSKQDHYSNLNYNYKHNQGAFIEHAVSQIKVHALLKEKNSALQEVLAFQKELQRSKEQLMVQKMKIKSLTAIMSNAKVDLDETVVYAKNNGIVQNLFASLGTPINIREPLFSFVDTDHLFVQANFSEIDLRRVRPGNKVSIYPRIYGGDKTYKGVVVSNNWASSRQVTDSRSQQQIVLNNIDHWILLPQRFPVQIRILNYDPVHYPLGIGASTYVYIHTR